MENQSLTYCKIQLHLNKMEWVNPINNIKVKNTLCVSSNKLFLKDNNKTEHWVDHSKLKTHGYRIFVLAVINELEASLTGATI